MSKLIQGIESLLNQRYNNGRTNLKLRKFNAAVFMEGK
ncbi:hypothetical protein KR50_21970 [Jeotgalibacillus campisalis]|uniref:Uncharacterized protein n=1 Tax=Jeotgalibacillus campisalis TaxID=220754 RepID=A0A0C2RCP6_9BACL|nr:hypothetical protein KR50_21970 [Jeotgalibacillus campisalis]